MRYYPVTIATLLVRSGSESVNFASPMLDRNGVDLLGTILLHDSSRGKNAEQATGAYDNDHVEMNAEGKVTAQREVGD